jgi:hypothetical protein
MKYQGLSKDSKISLQGKFSCIVVVVYFDKEGLEYKIE